MSTVKLIELRQDRRLIKSNFDGYKLSLDTIPVIKHELTSPPLCAKTSEDQYSFLHVELFSLHNHLVQDPWDTLSVYFINVQGSIQKCTYCLDTGRPKPPAAVYKLPSTSSRKPGDYNLSFKFLSEKFCLLCDGCNQIFLFDTGDRSRTAEWKVVFKSNVSANQKNFLIRDARLDMVAGEKRVNFMLQRVEHKEGDGNLTELLWYVILQSANKTWTMETKETFQGKSSVNYCALEPKSQALILSSNKPFKASSVQVEETTPASENNEKNSRTEAQNGDYAWFQTDEDVTIKFASRPTASKNDYKVTCTRETLQIKCKDETVLDGTLFDKVDTDLTTWILENNSLQVTLVKDIGSLSWDFLIPDGPQENASAQSDCNIPLAPPAANLDAQMEECDNPIQSVDEDYYIDRIDLTTFKPTHRVLLGSRPPLFYTCLRPGFPAAIATRQDVDACLWLIQLNATKPEEWNLRHEGTLHALGYVEASKQQKKFVNCSPDLNYAVICESYRHVFIYKSTYETASSLRNRNGPQISVGKQHLVTLEDAGEVVGMAIDNSITILLTEKFIMYLQINVE